MRSANRSPSPVRVGDVLLAALPALQERLLAERIRLGWRAAVGADLSRRSRPGELKAGTLTIMGDNPPRLQELSMRSPEVLRPVRARFASGGTGPADPGGPTAAVEAGPIVRRPIGAQGEAYDHYVIAQMEARAGRLPQAIGQLREAIKTDPDSGVLWIQLSQWLVRLNDVTGAFTPAQKAIALEPDNASAYLTPADLSQRQRRTPAAEAALEKAVALDPKTPDGYLALAQLHFEQKSYDKARAVLGRLVAARPNLSQGYYLLSP